MYALVWLYFCITAQWRKPAKQAQVVEVVHFSVLIIYRPHRIVIDNSTLHDKVLLPTIFSFYEEVASPLLSDVKIEYIDEEVNNNTLTNNKFPTYFQGKYWY